MKRYIGSYAVDDPMALQINSGNPVITGRSDYAAGQNIECPVIKYNQCDGTTTLDIIQNQFGANFELGYDIAIDNSNNIFIAGDTYIGALSYYFNIFYSKYNNNLTQQYIDDYGNLENQNSRKIKLDPSGNFYIGGTNQTSAGYFTYLLIKFNSNGVFQWATSYNNGIANDDHFLDDMVIDPNGYIYVSGRSAGSLTGFDIATLKYDFNGNLLWTNRYNGNGNGYDQPESIVLDSQGNIFVGGVSYEEENPSDDAVPRNTFIVIKYNPSNGTRSWVRNFYGNSLSIRDAWCHSLATDGNNNVICTGYAKMLTDYDFITIKYNPSGTTLWMKQYDYGNTQDYGNDVAVDNLNNVYVTGRSRPIPLPSSPSDYATIKYNASNGNQVWAARYNGTGNNSDVAKYISVIGNNNVFVTGTSVGDGTNFDFLTIHYYDAWLACDVKDFSDNNDINDVSFIDDEKISAVTGSGKILKSSNQGNSWIETINTGETRLNSVKFLNNNIGITAGDSGKIFYTTNGGSNWQRKLFNSDKSLNDIFIKSDGSIYFCGEKGLVGKASGLNGLITSKNLDTTISLNAINFINSNTGFATGSTGTIFKTTNNGNSWNRIQLNSNFHLNKIKYDSRNNFYVVGKNGVCLRSSNSGSTWQTLNTGVTSHLNDIFIKDSSCLIIAGDSGIILSSWDKGNTWEMQPTETYKNIRSVKFNSKQIGVATGENNLIIRTGFPESSDYSPGYSKNQKNIVIDETGLKAKLNNNYPNPFNPSTKISYYISNDSRVEIKIFDVTGKLIENLENKFRPTGSYSVKFDGSNLPSGVYFYRLNVYGINESTGIYSETKKMFLIK